MTENGLSGAFWARPVRAHGLLALRELQEKKSETLGQQLRKSVQFTLSHVLQQQCSLMTRVLTRGSLF
jgi:hypothetical protein